MSNAPAIQDAETDRTALAVENGSGSNGSDSSLSGRPTTAELMGRLLLTREEVALLLCVKDGAVSNLHRVELLRGVLVGKNLRWKPETVRQFVDGLNSDD